MHKFLFFLSIICLLVLVGCAATPTTTTLPPIPSATPALPTQTATVVPTAGATPSTPKPEQSPNLQPVNDAEEVFENGAWVVKNADGKVTATWDATEKKWNYNSENLQIVFGGATEPNSNHAGRDSYVVGVSFTAPDTWETPLQKDQVDPNPIVPLGVIDKYTVSESTVGSHDAYTIVEIGVDFRGIVFAEAAGTAVPGGHIRYDEYVAGFTVSDPNHPDMFYTITMPISDINDIGTKYNLVPDGVTTSEGVFVDEKNKFVNLMNFSQLIKAFQDPSTVGRRMVLCLHVPIPGQTYSNFTYVDPENQTFLDAMASGQPVSNLETSLTPQAIRVPIDIANIFVQK